MEKIAIIGTGTMGHSIALSIAIHNQTVHLYGINATEVQQSLQELEAKIDFLIAQDIVPSQEKQQVINNIITYTDLEEVSQNASIIIEAIPEDLELKQQVFYQLEQFTDEDTILASNSSSLPPTKIGDKLKKKDRLIGLHFWNPAHLVPLVEVIKSEQTTKEYVERSQAFIRSIKKEPVIVEKEIVGFIGNRLQFALLREAQYLYRNQIASIEDIDKAVQLSIGRRLSVTGPFLSADLGGLDVYKNISNYVYEDLANDQSSSSCLNELVEKEHFGTKSGQGYYDWSQPQIQNKIKEREQELIRLMKEDLNLK